MAAPSRDEGASAVEYGLIAAAIAGLVVIVVFALGTVVNDLFDKSCTNIQTQANTNQSC